MDIIVFYLIFFGGLTSFVLLIAVWIFFGRLIWLQMRVWLLARRGYHLVEHIGEDNIRRYYYLRPKDDHFDINNGFYLFMPDSVNKVTGILRKVNKKMLIDFPPISQEILEQLSDKEKKKYIERYEAEKEEAKKYMEIVQKLEYKIDSVSLRYGIPTITYYGTSPEPLNFKEKNKIYDAKTLKDLYLRILLTQKYGWFKRMFTLAVIALFAIGVILILYYIWFRGTTDQFNSNLGACVMNWNATQQALNTCINKTALALAQNSTIII